MTTISCLEEVGALTVVILGWVLADLQMFSGFYRFRLSEC